MNILKTKKGKIILASAGGVLIAVIVLIIVLITGAQTGYRSISVAELSGTVTATNGGSSYSAYRNMKLFDGYTLETDSESYSRLVLDEEKYIKLEESSLAVFEELGKIGNNVTTIRLERGAITNELTKPLGDKDRYVVNTPNAVLAVRGTFFRVEVSYNEIGEAFTDIYTYGGTVTCRRVMPDGSIVDEEVEIRAGYKACVKMDEVITIYVEEMIEEEKDDVDPLYKEEVPDDDVVDIYVASYGGHEMFLSTEEIWEEINSRGIDINEYKSHYDNSDIPHYDDHHGENPITSSNPPTNKPNADNNHPSAPDSASPAETLPAIDSEPLPPSDDESATDTSAPETLPTEQSADAEVNGTTAEPQSTTAPATGYPSYTGTPAPRNTETTVSADLSEPTVTEPEETEEITDETEDTAEEPEETITETTASTTTTSVVNTAPVIVIGPQTSFATTTTVTTVTTTEATTATTTTEVTTATTTTTTAETTTTTTETTTTTAEDEDEPDEKDKGVEINETNFPDEVFREYVSENFDSDSNGWLSDEEASSVTGINVNGTVSADGGITSLTGIEYFTKLKTLYCEYNSGLTALDVSSNTALAFLYCDYTSISALDVSKNTALTELNCSNTSISALDVSNNTALTELNCFGTSISTLDISANTALEKLYCYNTSISALDVSNNTALTELNCFGTSISTLDVSANTALEKLYCYNTSISALDVSKNTALATLNVSGTKLAYIDLTSNISISIFFATDCSYPIPSNSVTFNVSSIDGMDASKISSVSGADYDSSTGTFTNISDNISYTYDCGNSKSATFTLSLTGEPISGIAVNSTNFPDEVFRTYVSTNFDDGDDWLTEEELNAVTSISVSGTSSSSSGDGGVTSLTGIENFTNLTTLYCYYNSSLTEIDVSKNTTLTYLYCSITSISALDVSKNTALERLECYNTSISELDVSNNTALKYLECYNTSISELDISKNTALERLECYNTSISGLDVSNNTALKYLYCDYTSISELDVSKNTALVWLYCDNTSISELDVSKNTALRRLDCGYTSITELDVSNNTALEYLNCGNTNLPYIDVTANTALTTFTVSGCKYPIPSNSVTFKVSEIDGMDASKISDVTGADYDSATGTFSNITGDISYTYDCRNGYSEIFTLSLTGEPIPFDGTLYTENGDITISSTGVIQGEETNETAWSGDYVITQINSSVQDCKINILSGVHQITLDGINIKQSSALNIKGGTVTLSGLSDNQITLSGSGFAVAIGSDATLNISDGVFNISVSDTLNYGIRNKGVLNITGGKINISSTDAMSVGLQNGGTVKQTGGVVCFSLLLRSKQYTNNYTITGGSLIDTKPNGYLNENSDELECLTFDYFPSETERTFSSSNGSTYIYSLTENDCYDDGKYYVWKPISGIAVNSTNFPDEVFRTYVSTNFDDGDDWLTEEELNAVTSISVSGTSSTDGGVTSLTGVENFTNLTTLSCYYNSSLTEIDVSKNTALTELRCFNTSISELDLSKNTALTYLYCSYTSISELDLSKNTALTNLGCSNTSISELDVSKNTALTSLDCQGVSISELDVSNNTALTHLDCISASITELDVSKNTALTGLSCSSTSISVLDVSNNTALTYLDCANTSITELDISQNTALTKLYCYSTSISELDVSKNTALTYLQCHSTNLPYIDVTANTALTTFTVSGCKYPIPSNSVTFAVSSIAGMDKDKISSVSGADYDSSTGTFTNITGNISYTYDCGNSKSETFTLSLTGEPISGIAVNSTNFPDDTFRTYVSTNFDNDGNGFLSDTEVAAVTSIDVRGTSSTDGGVTSLTGVENFANLTKLYCFYNSGLTELDVSKNTALIDLRCYDTSISELNLQNNVALDTLYCDSTGISSLDLSNNAALAVLSCPYTSITSLDLTNNSNLTALCCMHTAISSLDLSSNTALTQLICNDTLITELDVSKNTALEYLSCYNTSLPYIDVTANTALTTFTVSNCKYPIPSNSVTFSVSSIDGMDASKISSVSGADYDSSTGTFSNITGNISYTYDCGNSKSATFTLALTGEPLSGVAVNSTNFPDDTFRSYVSTNFDDGDDWLTEEELNAVTTISVSGTSSSSSGDGGVTSLTGIENFTNLTTLECVYNSGLTEIDVSKNTALKYLYCDNTSISELDVSKNIALEDLDCSYTSITELDVSKNTALTYLSCYNTSISNLDVSKNTNLESLHCDETELTKLDLSGLSKLYDLSLSETINYLTISNTALDSLSLDLPELLTLTCSNNKSLITLEVQCPKLTSLYCTNNTELSDFTCSDTPLTTLSISGNDALEEITVSQSSLTSLDVSGNTALKYLYCYNNSSLASIDVSGNTELLELDCRNASITLLDVSKNTKLEKLKCIELKLTYLDLTANTMLTDLSVSDCITEISSSATNYSISGISGIDKSKITVEEGADYNSSTGVFSNFTDEYFVYTYDCGNENTAIFVVSLTK